MIQITAALVAKMTIVVMRMEEELDALQLAIDDAGGAPIDWDFSSRQELLEAATLLVRFLQLDIACYPLTEASVVFYDADGNEL